MVQRVPAPAEHHLLVNGSTLVSQFGGETLSKFAMDRILENRITSRNFKAGLDFTDATRARTSRTKLVNMFINFITKEFTFLDDEEHVHVKFAKKNMFSNDQIILSTMYDQSVIRYVRRINRFLENKNIPIRLNTTEFNNKVIDKIEIVMGAAPAGGRADQRSTLHYYKLMCFIPEIQGVFRALARKACYKDEDAKAISRSQFSGWVGIERPKRNAVDSGPNEGSVKGAKNTRGSGTTNRGGSAVAAQRNRAGQPAVEAG